MRTTSQASRRSIMISPSYPLRRLFARLSIGSFQATLAVMLCMFVFSVSAPVVVAQENVKTVSFDIPAGNAVNALKQFAAQSGQQLLYSNDDLAGVNTNQVKGRLSVQEALNQLLANTPLFASRDDGNGAVAVGRKADPNAPRVAQTAATLAKVPGTAVAQDGIVELSPFAVNARSEKGYRARESLTGAGITTDLNDMPIATSVINREFLQDSLVGQFNEALDYTTSVRQTSRSEIVARRSLFTVRGFQTPELMINGVRANENMPNNLIERIEVVKGPNALYGESDPGGLINVMLIQPLYQDRVEITQKAGSYGFLSTDADANVVSSDQRLRLRLVGEVKEFKGWQKNPADHTEYSYGVSAKYTLSKEASIALYGSHLQYNGEQAVRGAFPFNLITPQDLNGDGDFNDTIEGIRENQIRRNSPFLPRTFTSNTDDSYIDRSSDFFQVGPTFKLGDVTVQYLLSYSRQSNEGYGRLFNTFSNVGLENVFYAYDQGYGESLVHSLKVHKEATVGGIRNRFNLGVRMLHDEGENTSLLLRFANATERARILAWKAANPQVRVRDTLTIDQVLRAHSLSEADAKAQGIDYWNDRLVDRDFTKANAAPTTTSGSTRARVLAASLSDLMTFGDNRATVFWGARYTKVNETPPLQGGVALKDFVDDNLSYQLGLVYNLSKAVSAYANIATSYAGNRATNASTGLPYSAQDGKGLEIGTRFDLWKGRLGGSIAYYDLAKANVVRTIFDNTIQNDATTVADEISRGVEMEIFLTPFERWQTVINYTHMDAYVDKKPGLLPRLSLEGAAPDTYSLWTSYEFSRGALRGLRLGGGVVHVKGPVVQQSGTTSRWVIEDGYTELDFFARYNTKLIGKPATLGLNVNNANDVFYFRTRANANEPRRFVFSLKLEL